MINSKLSRSVLAMALLTVASGTPLFNVSLAHAQTTSGDLVGTIKDPSGAVVAGADSDCRSVREAVDVQPKAATTNKALHLTPRRIETRFLQSLHFKTPVCYAVR